MYTDTLVHQLYLPHLERERLRRAGNRETLRIARQTRLAPTARIRHTVGALLIATGERLRAVDTPRSTGPAGNAISPP